MRGGKRVVERLEWERARKERNEGRQGRWDEWRGEGRIWHMHEPQGRGAPREYAGYHARKGRGIPGLWDQGALVC